MFLGVVIQSLSEITVLAQKAGVPRHAFLDFINQSVMGSTFSRHKTPALVNLDFKVTFTPKLLRKDLDLGLDAARRFDVPMPLASITRDLVQALIGNGLDDEDFAKLDRAAGARVGYRAHRASRPTSTTDCVERRVMRRQSMNRSDDVRWPHWIASLLAWTAGSGAGLSAASR